MCNCLTRFANRLDELAGQYCWFPEVIVTITTIGFICGLGGAFVHVLRTIPGAYSNSLWSVLVPFSYLWLCTLHSFLSTWLRHAGPIGEQFVPGSEACKKLVPVPCLESKRNGCRRYCRKCKIYKPDRAHHCSTCKRCCLKMDHHCLFVANCVGHGNYKFFILFLFYSCVTCAFIAVVCVQSYGFRACTRLGGRQRTVLTVTVLLAAIFAFVVGSFGSYHAFLLANNLTTVEHMEKTGTRRNGKPYRHPYNVSIVYNIKEVLGTNPLLWLIPIKTVTPGDGHCFRTGET